MTRNQKIALGCGGAGCLGLIVVVIAGGLGYFFYMRQSTVRASRNYNYNVNLSDTNLNSNSNANSGDTESNTNSNSNTSPGTSMSDDDKHKLFHAASITGDAELIQRVNVKLGILNSDYTPGDEYQQFAIDHVTWAFRNSDFIREINNAEKARAYVNEHFE
jgi:hypothetical protein